MIAVFTSTGVGGRVTMAMSDRPADMMRLARKFARFHGWKLRGLVDRPDLWGNPSARALFVDRNGDEHERTVDDLRAEGD